MTKPLPDELPRFPLAHLPTPLEELPRLREALRKQGSGRPVPRLLVKRDDQTGLAAGGNKTRKLEYLVADALREGADTLVTAGAPQSNHCRQTAAAAARAGLAAVLVLGGRAPMLAGGNLLLDRILGARLAWAGDRDRGEVMAEVAERELATGRHPYIIPYGGSNAVGAWGYAVALAELLAQLEVAGLAAGHLVIATSSGGTQAGLVAGARAMGYTGVIHGISIDQRAEGFRPQLAALARATARHAGLDLDFTAEEFIVHDDYLGAGYGILGKPEREAIALAARSEGLLVDPVYTGRALAGLVDLIDRGLVGGDETVVFWHTGGLPAIFAYGAELEADGSPVPVAPGSS